ncbi:dienelactone hydrolase family protein [Congregibacter variabilis]|uniref:Dienelactone hydrolase family protein n=1 Tax=Congregibacter variabilis TaxID=3081200 RepID=A0ABZ0I577_9GAMM|nr:dienelactone hydrolase family protein [Congregibacter sp. IMCC43200]
MAMQEMYIDYEVSGATHQAFVAWDDEHSSPRPGVMVGHAWGGRSEFEEGKAKWLAQQGYVGVAIDMYGKGVRGTSAEENAALMTPLVENREELQARMQAGLAVVQGLESVDAARCAAMGYCFGGLCALDLARVGTEIAGVISIHGLFMPAENTRGVGINAKVLCLHGYDDPMADPPSMLALATELSAAGADWQIHAYGGTQHAFTNPQANDPQSGTVYSPVADSRATVSIANFLQELFRE